MFLNDQETATDLLYYEAIAKTVVRLIRETPDAPVSTPSEMSSKNYWTLPRSTSWS